MEKWDEWGGKGERNYLVVKRVKKGRQNSREVCTERGRIHKNPENLVECFIYINNYGSLITYTWYA